MVEDQILAIQAKIAEKHGSKDKLDLWLVGHWGKELKKLKYEVILTENIKGINPNR